MDYKKKTLMKKALLIVASSFLVYNIYQSITTTIFLSHFPLVINRLPDFIESSQPTLQLTLFIFQEIAGSIGSYLRLIGSIFALACALLFYKNEPKHINRLSMALFFESFYFLLLLPAAFNHIVGSAISSSAFLNFYAGISCLLQATLLFPPLLILSRKLKEPQSLHPILKWAIIAAPLYVFVLWVKHGLMWVYALSPSGIPQTGLAETVGSLNSLLTLLVAAIFTAIGSASIWKKKKISPWLAVTAIVLIGAYFAIYALVSIWAPIYMSFIPLTDIWMITFLILGIAVWLDLTNTKEPQTFPIT
jgi:hypothetical protein